VKDHRQRAARPAGVDVGWRLDKLVVRGNTQHAREHNLKNVDLEIPRDKLVVITGLSGSGKSSLAFDTIYAEGQRRYVESLSAYARQFLGLMEKPNVDQIEGLSPAISIDQKGSGRNPRSTVGTVTEVYDYLRLLYARIGQPHCPTCGAPITQQTATQIVDSIMEMPEGSRLLILAPIIKDRKGNHKSVFENAKAGLCARPRQRRTLRSDRGSRPGPLQDAHHRSGDRPHRRAPQAWTRAASQTGTDLSRGWPIRWRRRSSWATAC
jgi:excinuclease ABC subunit A